MKNEKKGVFELPDDLDEFEPFILSVDEGGRLSARLPFFFRPLVDAAKSVGASWNPGSSFWTTKNPSQSRRLLDALVGIAPAAKAENLRLASLAEKTARTFSEPRKEGPFSVYFSSEKKRIIVDFPYARESIGKIKALRFSKFDPVDRQWTLPPESLDDVLLLLSSEKQAADSYRARVAMKVAAFDRAPLALETPPLPFGASLVFDRERGMWRISCPFGYDNILAERYLWEPLREIDALYEFVSWDDKPHRALPARLKNFNEPVLGKSHVIPDEILANALNTLSEVSTYAPPEFFSEPVPFDMEYDAETPRNGMLLFRRDKKPLLVLRSSKLPKKNHVRGFGYELSSTSVDIWLDEPNGTARMLALLVNNTDRPGLERLVEAAQLFENSTLVSTSSLARRRI